MRPATLISSAVVLLATYAPRILAVSLNFEILTSQAVRAQAVRSFSFEWILGNDSGEIGKHHVL